MTLSIIIPVYNEKNTILEVLQRVKQSKLLGIEKEIIVIDDCSTDGTRKILRGVANEYKIIFKERNEGKGAAVKAGFLAATGDFVIIQDADLEYDPDEYQALVAPIVAGEADAVFGSRFISERPHRVLYFWHYLGNRALTTFSNMFTNLNLSDVYACYKTFNRKAVDLIKARLSSKRFGIEPELVSLASKFKLRVYEAGISYHGRTYEEGKKINWKDGVAAIWWIVRYGLFR